MKRLAAVLLTVFLFSSSPAFAQHGEHERRPFRTEHWVFDNRFHHDHFYPARGYAVTVLPAGALAITFQGGRYWYHSGVWFTAAGPGWVVAQPPVGIVVPALPPGATIVYVGGIPYYYANDVYYVAQPAGGYTVAAPPATAQTPVPAVTQSSPGAPPAAPGTWYYCESSKAYYPYVSDCQDGWKPVPATPPSAR